MSETIIGMAALQRRLTAISAPKSGPELMKLATAITRGQMIRNGPKKTGHTLNSLQPRNVTATRAELWGSKVIPWLDSGTGLYGPAHHKITPKSGNVLAWRVGAVRLSGSSRVSKGVQLAGWAYARSVKGMKGRPFIARSVAEAGKEVGAKLTAEIVNAWNGAG